MRESGTRTTAGAARVWMRSALVVGEVALAVTLVVGAGLLIRSFMNLTRVDMGFNRSQMIDVRRWCCRARSTTRSSASTSRTGC